MRFQKPVSASGTAGVKNGSETAMASDSVPHQPLCFLGRRTLPKLYLMLHLGRVLSQSGPVRLDTVNPLVLAETCYDHNGVEIHEYPDAVGLRMSIGGMTAESSGAAVLQAKGCRWLVDVADPLRIPQDGRLVLVMDPDRNSMEAGFSALTATGQQSSRFRVHRVYLDLCESSRIGARYLEGLLARHFPPLAIQGEWYALTSDERNQGVILDNQHEDTLRLNRLSPSYRALLLELAKTCFGLSPAEAVRCLRMADKTAMRTRGMRVTTRR